MAVRPASSEGINRERSVHDRPRGARWEAGHAHAYAWCGGRGKILRTLAGHSHLIR